MKSERQEERMTAEQGIINSGNKRRRAVCLSAGTTWAAVLFPLWLHNSSLVCLRC